MIITENIITSYLNCCYKSYLKLIKQIEERHLLQERYDDCILGYTEQFKTILRNREKSILVFENDFNLIEIVKSIQRDYFFNVSLKTDEHEVKVNIKKSIENNQVLFSPVLIIGDEKINDKHKILLAYYSYIIRLLFLITTDYGEVIYGKNVTLRKISIKRFIPQIAAIINNIRKVYENSNQYFSLNKHCKICEFNKVCKAKAIEIDHLSLISTIKESDIRQLNSKGIFTITQLSYTFKPRRRPKRQKTKVRKHFIALKALALRKKTIYILDSNIELENTSTKIYLDVEGYDEDNKFYYLIGVIIEREGIEIEKSYWISLKEDAKEVYKTFLKELKTFSGDNFIMFHYGKYEKEFLRYLLMFLDTAEEKIFLEKLTSNTKDVLPYFLNEIYFPTFSNDLKSISTYIGFNWTTKEASGLNSIVWRKYWEDEQKIEWKNILIVYNMEDCRSLKTVVDFLYSITNDDQAMKFPRANVSNDFTEETQQKYGGKKFGAHNYILEDYDFINKRAYFDYQKDKIFFRSKKPQSSNKKKPGNYFSSKPNQVMTLKRTEPCGFCGSLNTLISKTHIERVIIDLKILQFSVRKWIVKYVAYRIHCTDCGKWFYPTEYKKIGKKYGHNLMSWVIYQYLANNTSFEKIEKTLEDFFKISVGEIGGDSLQRFKELAAEYYRECYQKFIKNIQQWHILHTDETRVRLKTSNGYIWVFTNMETAVFIFRPDRTCTFIEKIIDNFKGVLISDFYKGYEALKCEQQKCLIHLLRDVNDNLFKEQQNDELKIIAHHFNGLLKKIVVTIDTYGLKKRNLRKHLKDVELFYKNISLIDYRSKNGKALFERFIRSKKSLFPFLNYDNVPWNNNNAEHSFKHFAIYRKQTNGLFTERSIQDYLILLSIYQTCKYRGINFLEFLLSKEIFIDEYVTKYAHRNSTK